MNRPGFGHIAFMVDDVDAALEEVLAAGGRAIGEVVTLTAPDGVLVYAVDVILRATSSSSELERGALDAFDRATVDDAAELCAWHGEVAADLTRRHGEGHWSRSATEKGILRRIETTRVIVARDATHRIVGTLKLVTKKPWAIDRAYFTPVKRPLYLINMDSASVEQRSGVGRRRLDEAARVARAWPAQSICVLMPTTRPPARALSIRDADFAKSDERFTAASRW